MDCLIRGASVVNEGEIFKADVLIRDGLICRIFKDGECSIPMAEFPSGAKIIDAAGKYLIPGIIDEHVHFREPGMTQKADIYTESRAAVCGGVTSFMDMPNTVPPTVTRRLLEEKFDIASQKSLANYSFYIGATNDNLDELLSIDTTKVCGIKLFMGSSTGNMLVDRRVALENLFREAPCLIAAHCEDEAVIKRNSQRMRELCQAGEAAPDASIHPLIRSREACLRSSRYAVELARKTGARLHILHVSTEAELSLFQDDIPLEQKRITAETCPHYLCLDDRWYADKGFLIKCNPAIKSPADRSALLAGLRRSLIDTIGTDHAPHLKEEKMTGNCFTSRSGFPSIQHSFDLVYAFSGLAVQDIVTLMCHNPAILYRIERRGFIREGYHADLALVDLDCPQTISDSSELSKCLWSPYDGVDVKSRITHTFVGGNLVYENGLFHEESRGERLVFTH